MRHNQLRRLVFHQHWPILLGLFILLIGISLFQGINGQQEWHNRNDPQNIMMETDGGIHYQKKTKDYVDREDHHYASKAAYYTVYRDQKLQVYKTTPTKRTHTTRGDFGTGRSEFSLVIVAIAGIVMIWGSRRRYLNEFLRTLGYRGDQIYRQQFLQYGSAIVSGVATGSALKLALLASRIPVHYWAGFSWTTWGLDLISDVLLAVGLFILASVLNLIFVNGIVALATVVLAYTCWWVPIALYRNSTANAGANYLSRHWALGNGLLLGLIIGSFCLANWLSKRRALENTGNAVIRGFRLPGLLLLSLPLAVFIGRIFSPILAMSTSWPALFIGWAIAMLGLTTWFYRPRWSRWIWRLVGQLR